MASPKIYDERALITALVEARLPPYPHEDFRTFRKARLAALEAAFGVRLSHEGVPDFRAKVLWMMVETYVASLLRLEETGFGEGGLLERVLDERDTPELNIRGIEADLHRMGQEYRKRHYDMLASLFRCIWGPLGRTVSSADLLAHGFDDSKEPRMSDHYDEM